jgi:hypothetical protein
MRLHNEISQPRAQAPLAASTLKPCVVEAVATSVMSEAGILASALPQVKVTEGPSAAEWASIKSLFIELYVHQGKRLSEIRSLLADQRGFYATYVSDPFLTCEGDPR